MRTILSLCLAMILACQPVLAWAQGTTTGVLVRLSQGTAVSVRPPYDIRSDRAKTGDVLYFLVTQPVRVNGITLIQPGARARVTVTEARHAAGLGQRGRLTFAVDTVEATDGTLVHLRGAPDHKGDDNTALSVAGVLIFSVFFVFLQGKEAVLKADKEVLAYVDEDRDFVVTGLVTTPPPQVVVVQPAPTVVTTVPASDVQRIVLCGKVDTQGLPVWEAEGFRSSAETFVTWFTVTPCDFDRVYDLRWYCYDRLVTSATSIVRARQSTAWVEVRRSAEEFEPGAWRVDLTRDGYVVGTQRFTVTR